MQGPDLADGKQPFSDRHSALSRVLPAGPVAARRDGEPARAPRGHQRGVSRDEGGRGRTHGVDVQLSWARKTMKQVVIDRYGAPEEVAHCAEAPDVGAPAAGEVVFDVLAFPINPADISFCRGAYRLKPPLPATPGAECVGRVTAVGATVTHVKPGDLVITMQRENWAQQRRVKGEDVIAVPPRMDLRQAAMLRINPPTALLLLTDIVTLKSGDWIIQNVANSAVRRLVIGLARQRGIRTVNVVRRDALFAELKGLGADVCVVDDVELLETVKRLTAASAIRPAPDP